MILSDQDILEEMDRSRIPPVIGEEQPLPLVEPWNAKNLQPASVDLTLANHFVAYTADYLDPILPIGLDRIKQNPPAHQEYAAERIVIGPGRFILGSTVEWVNIPPTLVASVEGKSSLARLGLFVHITAGFIDPGFQGRITLEFFNANHRPIELVAGLRVCQIAFQRLSSPANRPYGSPGLGSKYQNQNATTASLYRG